MINYVNGFPLNEVGIAPKKNDHVIVLSNHLGRIDIFCIDPLLEDQWRELLKKYCTYKR